MEQITPEQGYIAMFKFMEKLYEQTGSDDLAGFLGSMAVLEDGEPGDAAMWDEWRDAVRFARNLPLSDINLQLNK